MIYLDTHVVVWLYGKNEDLFSDTAKELLEEHRLDLRISPMVYLELNYLLESGRILANADTIYSFLNNNLGLKICNKPFESVVYNAAELTWTRDPFDRLIVAQAKINDTVLLSKDKAIMQNYENTIW